MNSKEKVKRSFSLRISSKIIQKRRETKGKNCHNVLKKSSSGSHITTDEDKSSMVNAHWNKSHHRSPPKHKRRSLILRSISNRFRSFPSFRHRVKLIENGDCENKETVDQKYHAKISQSGVICDDAISKIDVRYIGMKAQLSQTFKKTMPRKYKSASNFGRIKLLQMQNVMANRREKSCSDIGRSTAQKLATVDDLKSFSRNLSLNLKSRLDSKTESIDFSDLVKPVIYRMISQGAKHRVTETEVVKNGLKNTKFGNSLTSGDGFKIILKSSSPSPTCADIYGQDEVENISFHFGDKLAVEHVAINVKGDVNRTDDAIDGGDIVQETRRAISRHSESRIGRKKCKKCNFGKDVVDNDKEDGAATETVKGSTTDIFKGKKAKRISACTLGLDTEPALTSDVTESFGNPWMLQSGTDLKETVSKDSELRYESFGFDFNDFEERESEKLEKHPSGITRSDSRESVDSFTSSVHSVRTKELLFSDSEAEFDVDQISVSSSDSGKFEKTPSMAEGKSFDSSISILKSTKECQSLICLGDFSSEYDDSVKQTPEFKSEKSGMKQSISLDDDQYGPNKTLKALFGPKPNSFDLDTRLLDKRTSKDEKTGQKRSIDSSLRIKEMSLDLKESLHDANKSKLSDSSDSGLSSILSPVYGTINHMSVKGSRSNSNLSNIDENTKFFTLPNPRKTKSHALPKKSGTRMELLSKKLSEKAVSLSNIRLGSSFKLRSSSDSEKWKIQEFMKTNSLTNLMAKKGAEVASSLSTLIKGRTNPITLAKSPFKQNAKKKRKDENDSELVYEKVMIIAPRKRPANAHEIAAWKKRLKLNIGLAKNAICIDYEGGSRLLADGSLGHPESSGSLCPVRSPTLLDEILKSVDGTSFKRVCKTVSDSYIEDDSDGEESSQCSSIFLHCKKSSIDSESVDVESLEANSLVSVCKTCGKPRSSSGSDSSPLSNKLVSSQKNRCSQSLGDLNSKCVCVQDRRHCRTSSLITTQDFSVFKRKSKLVNGISDGLETDSSTSSPDSNEVNGKSSTLKVGMDNSFKPLSMFEFSEIGTNRKTSPENLKNTSGIERSISNPCVLIRHKRLMDLSADNIDDDEFSKSDTLVVMKYSDKKGNSCDDLLTSPGAYDGEKKGNSCGDLPTYSGAYDSDKKGNSCADLLTRSGAYENANLDTAFKTEVEDSETYHSCFDLLDTTSDERVDETIDYNQKSHSCSDMLDDREILLCDKLKIEDKSQSKNKIRRVKVKSVSSSHDALSILVPMEILNIGQDEEHYSLNSGNKSMNLTTDSSRPENNDEKSVYTTSPNYRENDSARIAVHSGKTTEDGGCFIFKGNQSQSCDEISNFCDKENLHCSCTMCNDRDDGTAAICDKCNKLRLTSAKSKSSSKTFDKFAQLSAKPPIPHKNRTRKFLSVNDISCQENNLDYSKSKIFSMLDLTKETPSDFIGAKITNIQGKTDKRLQSNVHEPICIDKRQNDANTPKTGKSKSRHFHFNDHEIKVYTKSITRSLKLDRFKSISSVDIDATDHSNSYSEKKTCSAHSLNRISSNTWPDDVFNRLSFPLEPPTPDKLPLHLDGYIESPPFSNFSDYSGLSSPDGYPEFHGPDVETVYKYDIRLGYLLHSVQCDNKTICVYSLQRNKQLMESVITPLASIHSLSHSGSSDHSKVKRRAKSVVLPNPATPITPVPSDQLAHAGRVLRTVLLSRFSHMVRDRKFHLRTYRRCMVGTEMVDWLMQQSTLVHSRNQAVGMWQALVEEGVVGHVCHEHQFKDKYLFYRFLEDDEGESTVPCSAIKRESEEDLQDIFVMLAQIGPDAMMRMILRKLPHERTMEDLEIIYEELLHIKALSHLSTMVKRELASVLVFESHAKAGTVLFNQGDEGKSWYILLKGSVNVVIYGKGVVCTLHEGDDFGKLALVNDAPRAATIVLRDDNCHFLRVDKDDFNRILRDVEANTVRLKEHGQDVLVLEKIPSDIQSSDGTVHAHYKYSVMAGTPEKMLEHLLESRLESKGETEIDGFLEDFLLTHVIFMPCNHLCPVLLSHYHSSMADISEQDAYEFMLNHKKCVLHFVQEWANIVGAAFREDQTIHAFLEELHSCVHEDLQSYSALKDDMVILEKILRSKSGTADGKSRRHMSGNFTLSRKLSKEMFQDIPNERKPIKPTDETIFKVYCADHTYSTLKLPRDTKVEQLLQSTKEKLGLGDDLILCEVKSTGERIIFKDNDLCVISGLSVNGRLFVTPKEHIDALTPLPVQQGPREGSISQIEMTSSREMAYHMTIFDWELFTCVQEYELIYQVFGRYKFGKITANLDLFLQRFNEIQYWVVTEMVLTSNLSKRVSLLRKFIKLASYCKEHQNLNSFFAIVMGLSNIAVSRLSQTWEKLPGKFKKMFADFETLMDPSRNHRVYRLSVAKMVPPIIPFMPLLMKDMTFTHEGNKTYFDGLVNFEKMHMISQTLKTVRFCRSAHLELEVPGSLKAGDTAAYIRNLKVIDNQRHLTQLSHQLEPRKT